TWFRLQAERGGNKETLQKAMRLSADGEEAGRIVGRARTGTAAIESIGSEIQRMAPPPLYDLTELQRHANRLFGFSAQQTLDVAQALYERHKLISYPRTDSRHLSQDVAATLPRIVQAIAAPYRAHLAPGTAVRRRCQGHRSPRHHSDDHRARESQAFGRRTQDLRPGLPPLAQRLARRSYLVGDHGDHVDSERRCCRSLSHIGHGGAAGGLEGAGYRGGQEAGERRRSEGGTGPAFRSEEGRSAGSSRCGSHPEKDTSAEAFHGRNPADGDGDGGQDPRREGTLRRHEGDRLWHPGA